MSTIAQTPKSQAIDNAADTDLPEGWTATEVQGVFESFGGGTPNKGTLAYWGGSIPWLSSGDIKTNYIDSATESITKSGLQNSSAHICRAASVVVVVRSGILAHTLPVGVLRRPAAINQDIKCFDSDNDELNTWLALAFRNSAKDILALNREGTTVQSVKYATLKEFVLRIPPLAEQKRIVAKIEELSSQANAARARLAKGAQILKRFRQAVLAAACSGRLTEDWRNLSPETKPASLENQRAETSQVLTGATEVITDTWQFATIRQLTKQIQYGYTASAKNQIVGPKFLRITDIQNGRVDWNQVPYCLIAEDDVAKYRLSAGDIVFARTGATTGKSFLIQSCPKAVFASYLIRVRPSKDVIPEYLYMFFQSDSYWKQIVENISGSAQPNCNATKLASVVTTLPPLPEQHEIVRRVEALFKLADSIEKRVEAATKRANKLTQAILAKAFRGELVPTEAELARREGRDYEPASELLARIKAERERSTAVDGIRVRRKRAARRK